jgi:hypothetical protein
MELLCLTVTQVIFIVNTLSKLNCHSLTSTTLANIKIKNETKNKRREFLYTASNYSHKVLLTFIVWNMHQEYF